MIFFLIHFSICKLAYDFISNAPNNLLLYIEPYEIVEIALKNNLGAFFSSWESFEKMTIEVYTNPINESQPLETFKSNNGLIGVAFSSNNFYLRILNEGTQSYKFFVYISYSIPNSDSGFFGNIPKGFSMPILEYAKKAHLKQINDLVIPFIYSYDSATDSCKTMMISMIVIMCIFFIVVIFAPGYIYSIHICKNKHIN